MTDDEATRAHDIGEMFAVLPSIDVHPAGRSRLPAMHRPPQSAPIDPIRSSR